jgi:hypothetical protein
MKRIVEMTVAEYRRLVKRLERRFGPDKKWSELPLACNRGRPRMGEKRKVLTVYAVKMTAAEWKAIQAEARAFRTTVDALHRSVLRPASPSRVVRAAGFLTCRMTGIVSISKGKTPRNVLEEALRQRHGLSGRRRTFQGLV